MSSNNADQTQEQFIQFQAICTVGCICCRKLLSRNETCSCWTPVATVDAETQTDPDHVKYGYTSEDYFTRGKDAHSMLHRAIRSIGSATDNRQRTVQLCRDLFPEIRSTPRSSKKLNEAIRRSKANRRHYNQLKDQAEMNGQSVRQLKIGKRQSTCIANDTDADEDLISYEREEITETASTAEVTETDSANTIVVIAEIHETWPTKAKKSKSTPVKQSKSTPVIQSKSTPVKQSKSTPVIQRKSTPVKQSKSTPVIQSKSTPVIQSKSTPVKQSKSTPVKQSKSTPVIQRKSTPVKQSKSTPVIHSKSTPVKQSKSTPVIQSKSTPVKQSKSTPVIQSKSTPVKQSKSTPLIQSKSTPVKQSKSTPVIQSKSTPVKQSKSTPVKHIADSDSEWSDEDTNRTLIYYCQHH